MAITVLEKRRLRRFKLALVLASQHGLECRGFREHLEAAERLLFLYWLVRRGRLSEELGGSPSSWPSSSPAASPAPVSASGSGCS